MSDKLVVTYKGEAVKELPVTITSSKDPIPESSKCWGEWDKDELKRVMENIFTKYK